MSQSWAGSALLVLATICGLVGIVLLSVAFATDHWTEMSVNVTELSVKVREARERDPVTGRITSDRYSGMWRECFPGRNAPCK